MLSTPVKKWMGIIVLPAALAGTHWWAYRLGVKMEHARIAHYAEQLFNTRQEEALQQHLEFLRVLAKRPRAFDVKDVKPYCDMSLVLAKQVEKAAIVPSRASGDDPRADRWQQRVNEVRRLTEILTKRKS